jgi:hypothetical protein
MEGLYGGGQDSGQKAHSVEIKAELRAMNAKSNVCLGPLGLAGH